MIERLFPGLAVQHVELERDEEEMSEASREKRAGKIGKTVAKNVALGALFHVPGLVVGVASTLADKAATAVHDQTAKAAEITCKVTAVRVERLHRINAWGNRSMSPFVKCQVVRDGRVTGIGRTRSLYRVGASCVFPEGRHSCLLGLPSDRTIVLVVEVKDEPELRLIGAARSCGPGDPFLVGTAAVALEPLLTRVVDGGAARASVNLGLCRGDLYSEDAGLVRINLDVASKVGSSCAL